MVCHGSFAVLAWQHDPSHIDALSLGYTLPRTSLEHESREASRDLEGTRVSDISVLTSLNARRNLDLKNTQVTDIAPLAALPRLTSLDISGAPVSNGAVLPARNSLTIIGTP